MAAHLQRGASADAPRHEAGISLVNCCQVRPAAELSRRQRCLRPTVSARDSRVLSAHPSGTREQRSAGKSPLAEAGADELPSRSNRVIIGD